MMTIEPIERHVAITGATGSIGRSLCTAFTAAGWHVTASRRSGTAAHAQAARWVTWDLADPPPRALCQADVIVHLACDCIAQRIPRADEAEATDVRSTRRLRAAWLEAREGKGDGRFILLSSRGASAAAANQYGRIKYHCEQVLVASRDVIVRPSLVFGNSDRGLYALLRSMLTRLPALPVPTTPASFVPIHMEVFCAHLVQLASAGHTADGPMVSMPGEGPPLTLRQLLEFICKRESLVVPVLISIPAQLMVLPLRALAPLSNTAYFLKERLLGLFNPTAGIERPKS